MEKKYYIYNTRVLLITILKFFFENNNNNINKNKQVNKMEKNLFYAVLNVQKPGIYFTWADCMKQISTSTKAQYRGFKKREDADKYFKSEMEKIRNHQKFVDTKTDEFIDIVSKDIGTDILSDAQKEVLTLISEGKNVFFTGSAGTGKSYIISLIKKHLPQDSTFITALTGIAAANISGTTLHKFAGIGKGEGDREYLLTKARSKKKNWCEAKILIIDEVSMLDSELFENLDYIAKSIRNKRDLPFGGIQMILCGDFFQLPPIDNINQRKLIYTKNDSSSSSSYTNVNFEKKKYCFQSSLWEKLFEKKNMIILTQIFRQQEKELLNILQQVRYGSVDVDTIARLSSLSRPLEMINGIVPTKLYSKNENVDKINNEELNKLESPSFKFVSKDWKNSAIHYQYIEPNNVFNVNQELILKVDAQVMLIQNLANSSTLVNGSRGVITKFKKYEELNSKEKSNVHLAIFETNESNRIFPVVKFMNGREVTILPTEWELHDYVGKKIASRKQIPLKLAWAITIHKSQGLTLDYLEIDLSHCFEYGQAYVALSRASKLDGLRVLSFIPSKIKCNPVVVDFYQNLTSLENKKRKSNDIEEDDNDSSSLKKKSKKNL
jgi:ATP-dependent DNA helicase PIF1